MEPSPQAAAASTTFALHIMATAASGRNRRSSRRSDKIRLAFPMGPRSGPPRSVASPSAVRPTPACSGYWSSSAGATVMIRTDHPLAAQ